MKIRILDSLGAIDAAGWNAIVAARADGNPFLRHEFLHAMHATGCASAQAGWQPQFVTAWDGPNLAGFMPLYLKDHSYGEYVFDWAWADAYQRHGLQYYPKLLAAIPFSPVSAPKLVAMTGAARDALCAAVMEVAQATSSLHILFPDQVDEAALAERGMMTRRGVQFHWTNDGYRDFDDFLARFSHDKRKKIKQERRKVREAGITFMHKVGAAISPDDWAFFNKCYRNTYRAHQSTPYLNLAFFRTLGATLPENVMVVIAMREGEPIASTLNIFTAGTLWGRYWGALEYHPALHFEACYYQALEFCIARGIKVFEGGAQGEHKLARGFMPVETRSLHWLKHPQFADAVEKFLQREAQGVGNYIDELREHAPFRAEP